MGWSRQILAVISVLVLLFGDRNFQGSAAQYAALYGGALFNGAWRICLPGELRVRDDPFAGFDDDDVHLIYVLNGGTNSSFNLETVTRDSLPVSLGVPEREGYNFAGWYTDSQYQDKITEISLENAGNKVLFAKWTKAIDSGYNVEMYSYHSGSAISGDSKELKECIYGFLDDMEIPGMPSTREQDYLDNVISSDGQCVQGLCFTPELVLITAYSEEAGACGSLLAFDRDTGEYLATVGMKKNSHLGGIAFDGENIWICHSNFSSLERIPYGEILEAAEERPGCRVDLSEVTDEYGIGNTPSCITCYGGRIWVATHTKLFDSQMVSYSYDEEQDTLCALSSYNIPSKVQGIAFDEDGTVYLSTSYGRNNSSYLKVYSSLLTLTGKPDAPSMKVEMPPCSEEIAVADGNVYVLFESASRKYFEGTDGNGVSSSPIDKVLSVEVASLW